MTTNLDSDLIQSRVAKTVWPWREPVPPISTPVSCRKRAIVQFLVMLAVAGFLSLKYKHAAVTVSCVALFVIVTGLFLPKVFLTVERGFKLFGHGVGVALTWLLLVAPVKKERCIVDGEGRNLLLRDRICRRSRTLTIRQGFRRLIGTPIRAIMI